VRLKAIHPRPVSKILEGYSLRYGKGLRGIEILLLVLISLRFLEIV